MEKERFSSKVQKVFDNLQKRNGKSELLRQKPAEILNSDCSIYNTNPPEIPATILENLAVIPDLLEETPDEHYEDKIYEQPLYIDPDIKRHADKPEVEQKWTSEEKDQFELACKQLNKQRRTKTHENKIERLHKYHFPNKKLKDIVEYYYMCYKPALRKKQIETKWTSNDKTRFESECRKLNETLNEDENTNESKIKHLKECFPSKTDNEITQYYNNCYKADLRKKNIEKPNENEEKPTNKRKRKQPPSEDRSDTKRIKKETG